MKKKKRMISALLAMACIAMAAVTPSSAEPALTLTGGINWVNEPDTDSLRPDSVNVYLLADGEQVAQTKTTAGEDWQFSFVILPTEPLSAYTYAIGSVPGYEEDGSARVDPEIDTVPAEIGTWEKYEPCNSLSIPQAVLSDMLIAGKMTQHRPLVIWSREPLTAEEQANIEASFRALPGVGNPPPAEFISGDGARRYGMEISLAEGTVNFDDPSQWSLLFGASYTYGKTEIGEGALTMRWIPVFGPPADPAPFDPAPADPMPVDPAPVDPEPVQPPEDIPEDVPEDEPPAPKTDPKAPIASPTVLTRPTPPSTPTGSTPISAPKTGMPADYYAGICGAFCSLALIAGLLVWKKRTA